jgi:hypothetical protein
VVRLVQQALHGADYYARTGIPDTLGVFLGGLRRDDAGHPLATIGVADVLGLAITALVVIGLIVRGRRLGFPEMVAATFLGALLVWPGETPRLGYPILPLLYLFVYSAVRAGAELIRGSDAVSRSVRVGLPSIIIGGLAIIGVADATWNNNANEGGSLAAITSGPIWLAEHTPPDSIIMTQWPEVRFLYSQRKMVDLPRRGIADAERADAAERIGVNYVLIAPTVQQQPEPRLDIANRDTRQWLVDHPERYRLVFEDADESVSVFQVAARD